MASQYDYTNFDAALRGPDPIPWYEPLVKVTVRFCRATVRFYRRQSEMITRWRNTLRSVRWI